MVEELCVKMGGCWASGKKKLKPSAPASDISLFHTHHKEHFLDENLLCLWWRVQKNGGKKLNKLEYLIF